MRQRLFWVSSVMTNTWAATVGPSWWRPIAFVGLVLSFAAAVVDE